MSIVTGPSRIAILGSSGMLGTALMAVGNEQQRLTMVPVPRSAYDLTDAGSVQRMIAELNATVLINAVGARPDTCSRYEMVEANAVIPHVLASACRLAAVRLVHISTDCVFAPGRRERAADETPDPVDIYGWTKAAGEPIGWTGAIVVRTSFIGPRHGLWRWFLDYRRVVRDATGDEMYVYMPAWDRTMWSGSHVMEVAQKLLAIAQDGHARGVIHLATAEPESKASVIELLAESLDMPTLFNPANTPDRSRILAPTTGWELRSMRAAMWKWGPREL